MHVYFAHRATPDEQARAGFGASFDWDIDLTSGYSHEFLENVSKAPGADHFMGCDTPAIGERLRLGRFDALLVSGWQLKSNLQGLFAAKKQGIPVMVRGDSHLDTPRGLIKKAAKAFAYPRFLKLFDAALYVGNRSRAYYEHYRYPSRRLFFSPHSVDTKWFAERATGEERHALRSRLGIAPEKRLFLFAGKFVSFKRPQDLIAAAAVCRANGLKIELMMAGDGALRESLAVSASAQGVPIHFLGFCNQTKMPGAYAASDCLVLPSERETWGLVANEAVACGLPIIVSDECGCAPDLATDGHVGRTFPAGNIPALAKAICGVASAPPVRDQIQRLASAYSLDATAEGVLTAFDTVGRG
ncbi:MAG: glycosyltransferase family 4 protein [Rhodomicrobium sp.]